MKAILTLSLILLTFSAQADQRINLFPGEGIIIPANTNEKVTVICNEKIVSIPACKEGQIATTAAQFQADTSSHIIETIRPGTLVRFDKIYSTTGRYIVEMSIMSPLTPNPKQVRTCVGSLGYCASSYAPKQLIFNECQLKP
jgi:hypothetical protein